MKLEVLSLEVNCGSTTPWAVFALARSVAEASAMQLHSGTTYQLCGPNSL